MLNVLLLKWDLYYILGKTRTGKEGFTKDSEQPNSKENSSSGGMYTFTYESAHI